MFETLKNAFKEKEVRVKLFWTFFLLLIYRLGCYIPVPGLDIAAMQTQVESSGNQLLTLLNSITGGSLANCTLFAMGIGPYINSSIIIKLLTVAIPKLERWQKHEGDEGRRKITMLTRIASIFLTIIQAVGVLLSSDGLVDDGLLSGAPWLVYAFVILVFCAGNMLTVWLGERLTEKGIGNGLSMLIFVGIISTAGIAILESLQKAFQGGDAGLTATWQLIGFLVAVVVIFALIVFVDLSERKIPVQYAKQVKGRKVYGGQSTHIPIRVNASGVMPLIFAFVLLSFPSLLISMFDADYSSGFAQFWMQYLGVGTWAYSIILALLILFFAFFYGQIQFNPEDISKNFQQTGGYIPGIRPGKPTTEYLKKINNRITLFGAIYLAFVALVPTLIFTAVAGDGSSLINAFSTTGLLIVVSCALDFHKQLEAQIMMRHYKGFLS